MNETLKRFLYANSYQLIVAVVTFVTTIFAAYVSLQLFQQSTAFQIQALQRDVSKLQDNAVQRNELKPINEKLEDIQGNVNRIVDHLLNQ